MNHYEKLKKLYRLKKGGFPESISLSVSDRNRLLQDYLDVVIFRDIVERHEITNISLVHYVLRFLINNPAGVLSVNKLFNFTLLNY